MLMFPDSLEEEYRNSLKGDLSSCCHVILNLKYVKNVWAVSYIKYRSKQWNYLFWSTTSIWNPPNSRDKAQLIQHPFYVIERHGTL